MNSYKLLFMLPILLAVVLAVGCDNDSNSNNDDPPTGDPVECPCFSEADVTATVEMVAPEFRVCGFKIGGVAVALPNTSFTASCVDCEYSTSNCFCQNNMATPVTLNEEEFNACAQALLAVIKDNISFCIPAEP